MSDWTEKSTNIAEIKRLIESNYEIEVDSPDGWVKVTDFVDKGYWEEYVLDMQDGKIVRCNENHLFETTLGWLPAIALIGKHDVNFLTQSGYRKGSVRKTGNKIPIVDITVEHENHRYFTNGVSSHNTGVGKTLAMCHMAAANLNTGLNVLYITNEMAEEKIAERIDANLLNVFVTDLRDMPRDLYEKKITRLREKTTGKLIIKEYPTATASVINFRSLLNELNLKRSFKPDIIYIDYLNICASARIKPSSNINSYTYIKAIAEELRGLAVEYNVPVISATQTTRSGFGSTDVELTDTSESFGLPATADFMIALITTEDLEQLNQIMVKQLKNRYNDPTVNKRFVLGIERAKMRLYNVEQDAQKDISDSGQKPVFDKTKFGTAVNTKDATNKFKELKI